MMSDESSIEFDMYEDIRLKLTRIFTNEGRDPLQAERIALYIVQGVRDIPKLLTLVSRGDVEDAKVREIIDSVLDNAAAFEKARDILHGPDDAIVH